MDADMNSIIKSEMEPYERLIWSGQPKQGLRFQMFDIFLIPFSLIWGGGVIASFFAALFGEGAPPFVGLFLIPFLLVGLYFIFGRFLVDIYSRKKTYYGLTNERIIIISGIFSQTVKSLILKTLPEITVNQHRDGRGTIQFGPTHPFTNMYGSTWPGFGHNSTPQFEMIENAKNIYNQIRHAQKGLQS
jgi:hypothetical protein